MWGDTTAHLPKTGQTWGNVYTEQKLTPERGEDGLLRLAVGEVLAGYPVGVLVNYMQTILMGKLA